MRIKLHPGVYGTGIAMIGGGLYDLTPDQRWIGVTFIAIGICLIGWGVKHDDEHWWAKHKIKATWPYALLVLSCLAVGSWLAWHYSRPRAGAALERSPDSIPNPTLIDMWKNLQAAGDSGGVGTSIIVKKGSDSYVIPMYSVTNNESNTKYARFLIITNFNNFDPIDALINDWDKAKIFINMASSSQIMPGQDISDPTPMTFGGQVYIYTNGILSIQEKYKLIEEAKSKKLNLVFRDFYFLKNYWDQHHPIGPNLLEGWPNSSPEGSDRAH